MTQPLACRKLVAHTLSADFRAATRVVSTTVDPRALKPTQVLVRNAFVGINASDTNFTAGRYKPGVQPPFDTGFEAIGVVVAAGSAAGLEPGTPVATTSFGAFSELQVLPARMAVPLPSLHPRYLPLLVSGLTASLALEKVGEIRAGETVLVTAAAGATGQYAVQLAKLAGCHVIGTCSSRDKAAYLRTLGCDRVVDYTAEDLHSVLRKEYPRGVDVVYECVGGRTFDAAVANLATKGRCIIIGFISGYADQSGWVEAKTPPAAAGAAGKAAAVASGAAGGAGSPAVPLHVRLLAKSASVRGFFLNDFLADAPEHLGRLLSLAEEGKLAPGLDPRCEAGAFRGLEAIPAALEFLYSRKNVGKVFVDLRGEGDQQQAVGARARL
jgi:NADPH-dependent curcumin reductase CurA